MNGPHREAIARGGAKCAAERKQRETDSEDRWTERMAADAKNKQAHCASIGVHPS